MAKGRTWASEEKAKIVLQGIRGRAVAELCNEYQIHQTQYYKWRDKFLENASRVFDADKQTAKEQRLKRENQKLKQVVGELTVELKKAMGKAHAQAARAHFVRRCRATAVDLRVESWTSVLGLSPDLGIVEVRQRCPNQSKARLSPFEREPFAC
jgi:transposase-like protein